LTTRFGRRPILIIGLFILGISSLEAALNNTYWGLLLAWGVQGIGAALFMVAATIILADISTSKDRGQVMATFQGCHLIGSGIGPVMGGFVAEVLGYQWVFIVFAILVLISFVISYFRIPETQNTHQVMAKPREQSPGVPAMTAAPSGIRPLLLDFSFVLVSLVTVGNFIMRIAAQNQILPLMSYERMGLSSGKIGIAMTVIIIFQFLATLIGGRLSDRFGRKIIIFVGCLIGALSLLILAQSYTFEVLIVSCAGMGIGVGMAGSTALAYVIDITPRSNYDAGMGLYRTFTDSAFVIGPILMGWLADAGGFSLSLLFNCFFLFIIAIVFQIFARGWVKNKSMSEVRV
jgi:MFS transporter, DHA1 family, multidrug resistance protein